MENRKIERDIDKLVSKYGKNNDYSLDGSIRGFKITQYIEQLEQENKELRQRLIASNAFGLKSNEFRQEAERKLQALDKALDKATNLLSREVKQSSLENPGGIYMEPGYWKEWCMNNE